MTEMRCACGQSPRLWTTGENPVDKSVSQNTRAMSLDLKLFKDLTSDIQQATLDALELLNARIAGLEHTIWTIQGILDQPLTPDLLIDRLRALREAFGAQASEDGRMDGRCT